MTRRSRWGAANRVTGRPGRRVRSMTAPASGGVVEDEAEGEPLAGPDHGHAVPDGPDRPASRRSHWPLAGGEDQPAPLRDEGGGRAGLGTWPLLAEQELAAGVVFAGVAEVDHDLQWEHELAVEVAVQRVPAALLVAEQDRGRLRLPGGMAHVQPFVQGVRPGRLAAQLAPPVTGDRQQLRVQRLLQAGDRVRERLGEVLVLALAEPVAGHVDRGPEPVVVRVQDGDAGGLVRGEQRPGQGAPDGVELAADLLP